MRSLEDRIREAELDYLREIGILSRMLLDGPPPASEIDLQGEKMKQAQRRLGELMAQMQLTNQFLQEV
jgi:hypothetical protein